MEKRLVTWFGKSTHEFRERSGEYDRRITGQSKSIPP
jgi:hypothetical protein